MSDPTINRRRAESLRPIIDAAMEMQRRGRLVSGTRVKLDLTADALIEVIAAFEETRRDDGPARSD